MILMCKSQTLYPHSDLLELYFYMKYIFVLKSVPCVVFLFRVNVG